MDTIDKNKVWYDNNIKEYDTYADKVCALLKTLIDTEGIPYHSIDFRVKSKDSFLEKCDRKKYLDPEKEMMDIAGLRIIAYTKSDVQKICNLIKEEFDIDNSNSEDKAELLNSDQVGYLSVHYIAKLSKERIRLKEYSKYSEKLCEIQIRTLLQHAWAEIEHDRSYKFSGTLPTHIRRRFYLVAGVLEMMDDEFQRLAEDIDHYAKDVRSKTKKGSLDIPLDSTSLLEYLSIKTEDFDIERGFRGADKKIIDELIAFNIKTINDLDPLFSKEFRDNFKKYFYNVELASYLSLLRDAMICYDAKRYFEDAWKGNWQAYDSLSRDFWEDCGVDLKIIDKFVAIFD